MFFVTKQSLDASIRMTAEGRVYYPAGRAGYVLDADTERNVARVITAYFFLVVGTATVCAPLAAWTHHRLLVIVIGVACMVAIRYAALAYVLRAAPRSAVSFSQEDAVHRTAATYGAERIYLMVAAFFLMVPASAFVARDDARWEQVATTALFLAIAVYAGVFAVRVLRAQAAMRNAPADGDCA